MVDLIVLGGAAAIEQAVEKADLDAVEVPFTQGRAGAPRS
jgi:catalase (peroxidase I)